MFSSPGLDLAAREIFWSRGLINFLLLGGREEEEETVESASQCHWNIPGARNDFGTDVLMHW